MTKKKPTKAELRVEVAKDVLKHRKTLRVLAGNTYVKSSHINEVNYSKPSQDIARDLQKKGCEVCALGACFLSLVALKNEFDLDGSMILTRREITNRLRSVFSDAQMDLIEEAFEWDVEDLPYGAKEKRLNAFACKYRSNNTYYDPSRGYDVACSDRRLRAIMKNIIENKGTFKP